MCAFARELNEARFPHNHMHEEQLEEIKILIHENSSLHI
jgi:hypothetical protein